MKEYTSDAPVFKESIPIVETNDLVNAENNNAAVIQLLQNILVLQDLKVNKEEGKGLVSDAERNAWNATYEQSTGYVDQKIAELVNGAPDTLDTLKEIADAIGENESVVEALSEAIGKKANQVEVESLLGLKLDKTGDSKDNTVTFTSSDTTTPSTWTEVETLKSGETHRSFLQKISTMFRNVRYLAKILGTTDISKIGDGTVTGAIGTLNDNLPKLVTLWENPAPTKAMGEATLELSAPLSDFDYIEVIYGGDITSSRMISTGLLTVSDVQKYGIALNFAAQYMFVRTTPHITDMAISWRSCVYTTTYGVNAASTNNNYLIPHRVIGVKINQFLSQ